MLTGQANAVGKMLGATITQIITVDRGDHHILQAHISNRGRQVDWLFGIQRIRTAVANVTERAATCTDVAHDHKGCGTAAETLSQIRTTGFLANGMQLMLTQFLLNLIDLRSRWNAHADPVWFTRYFFGRNDFNRDAGDFICTSQFFALHYFASF